MAQAIERADLEITRVLNDSDPNNEYVEIKVVKGGHTKKYALVDTTFDVDGKPSNHFRHIFIFPRKIVATGDYIWVCTGSGTKTSHTNTAKSTTHILYWNSKDPVWNDKEGDKAVLIKYAIVNSVDVPAKKAPPAIRKLRTRPKI